MSRAWLSGLALALSIVGLAFASFALGFSLGAAKERSGIERTTEVIP